MYNIIFALCTFGGNVDDIINNCLGPYVFRVNNDVYHNIGSLLPLDGFAPKFAQFYMYDGQEAINHRLNFPRTGDKLDPDIFNLLLQMLTRDNVLVEIFKQIRERYHIDQQIHVRLRLLERSTSDGRFVNLLGVNDYEFVGLAVDEDLTNRRDILVHYKQRGLQPITELHPCFMSLQYPLLFPHGEDGFQLGIKYRGSTNVGNDNENTHGDVSAADVGKRIVLPSSFTGEIQRALAATGCGDTSAHTDIVARLFKLKLVTMMSGFTKKDVLGSVLAVDGDKILSTDDIDFIISVELPDKEADNVAYHTVAQFMMHEPCGAANPRCPCMANEKCINTI
ncbi:uncharacterized protein LOC141699764 [Apium graveolens]|uniref:uncharacterized protein LOC141699764 n=1 Tax=Apium graveolens TaxID=4045 RepID=UPI003D7A665D